MPDAKAVAGGGVLGAVRGALHGLVKGARSHRVPPGGLETPRVSDAARAAWLNGIAEALSEMPVVVLGVSGGAIYLGDIPVLDGAERDVAETLHAAGARGMVLFAGISEDELLLLARILLTAWQPSGHGEVDLEMALWGQELPHVHFELVGSADGPEAENRAPGRLRRSRAESAPDEETSEHDIMLSEAALAELRSLRDTAPPEPATLVNVQIAGPLPLPPELVAESAAVQAAADLDPAQVATVLHACLAAENSGERAVLHASAMLHYALGILGGPVSPSPFLHHLLGFLDPELNPDHPHREAVRTALQAMFSDPHRERLLRVLADAPEEALRGELFSLFSLIHDERVVHGLAENVPRWVARVLADSLLLRETADGSSVAEPVRRRLQAPGIGSTLLALAMAARSDDARLIEPVLQHRDHADPVVREAVLYALRKQRSARVRDVVRRRLDDPAEVVRVEALRYCVAYRDTEMGPRIESRLLDPALGGHGESEIRALCLSYARLMRERAERPLLDIALGTRRGHHPVLPGLALQALRVVGTPGARTGIERVANEVPALSAQARALLEER